MWETYLVADVERKASGEMSRRSSNGVAVAVVATSRRTRRVAEQPLPPAFASNPIFVCEDGSADRLRPRYGAGSLHAHVPSAGAWHDGGKLLPPPPPLPLPPSRAHREGRGGTHVAAWHFGPTIVLGPHGRVVRIGGPAQQKDPFLAAYVVCTKGKSAAPARKPPPKRRRNKTKRGEAAAMGGGGCGVWNGWAAAGARYAGAMSCRHGSAVAVLHGAAPPPSADAPAEASPAHPRLDLSRPPAVLPGRRRALN